MTKEERLACLDKAKKLEEILPKNAEIINISMVIPSILLWGEFDFREFAESLGAEVHGDHIEGPDKDDYISLHTSLFGFNVLKNICPGSPRYELELQRCENL